MAGHEDRAAVMITAPVIDELGRPPSGEDRTSRVPLFLELPGRPGRLAGLPVCAGPLVQPLAILATEESLGSAMYPSRDIDMSSTDEDICSSPFFAARLP